MMGRAALLPRGVGFETELGDSPWLVCIVPLLYTSSRGIFGSFKVFTTAGLPGFLLYSMLMNWVNKMTLATGGPRLTCSLSGAERFPE